MKTHKMHILGLPNFDLSEVIEYVLNRSAFLPVLARIKLPENLYHEHEVIEKTLKIAAVELAYLRLAEMSIAKEIENILLQLKENTNNKELQDKRTALNLQKEFILSLNEQKTAEALQYCYFNVIWPFRNNPDDKKQNDEISKMMHGHVLSKSAVGLYERGKNFGDFLDLIKNFLTSKKYQSKEIILPANIEIYLSDYLKESDSKSEGEQNKYKPK